MCRVIGAKITPRATSCGDQLGAERPSRAGHLGAARAEGEDRLVRRDRERLAQVAVADRPGVRGQVLDSRVGELDPAAPEPVARCRSGRSPAPGRARPARPWRRRAARSARRPGRRAPGSAAYGGVRSSTTRVPSASRLATCTTIGRPARTPSSWPGTVAEVLTTSTSPARRWSPIRANRVCRIVGPVGDQQPDPVAAQPALLGRFGRGRVVGRGEPGRRRLGRVIIVPLTAGTAQGCRQIGRPVAPARPPGPDQGGDPRGDGLRLGPVADVLAGERGLVHRRPQSPGSTAYQVNRGSSAAQVRVWWSRAALLEP